MRRNLNRETKTSLGSQNNENSEKGREKPLKSNPAMGDCQKIAQNSQPNSRALTWDLHVHRTMPSLNTHHQSTTPPPPEKPLPSPASSTIKHRTFNCYLVRIGPGLLNNMYAKGGRHDNATPFARTPGINLVTTSDHSARPHSPPEQPAEGPDQSPPEPQRRDSGEEFKIRPLRTQLGAVKTKKK